MPQCVLYIDVVLGFMRDVLGLDGILCIVYLLGHHGFELVYKAADLLFVLAGGVYLPQNQE